MTRPTIIYVTYDGLLEPLGQSQVLPYLLRSAEQGFSLELISFEKPEDLADSRRVEEAAARVRDAGVAWRRLPYHRTPSLPATAWDIRAGRRAVAAAVERARERGALPVVHARGYVPGLMALAGRRRGARFLFDMRGFWVDERIQGGYWSPRSPVARLARRAERTLLEEADHLVLLTRRAVDRLPDLAPPGWMPPPHTVIPTCVDLRRFEPPAPGERERLREELALGPGPVLIHAGTVTGWYAGMETFRVGRAFVEETGGTFLVLTRDRDAALALARETGAPARIEEAPPHEMPRWLKSADAGLALVRPLPSKDASFPTRVGEYLATGLAVLATDIGDMERLEDGTAVRLYRPPEDTPEDAARWLAQAVTDPETPQQARETARRHLDLDEGVSRLAKVYRSLGGTPVGDRVARPWILALALYPEVAPSTRFRLAQFVEPLKEKGFRLEIAPFLTTEEYLRFRHMGPAQQFRFAVGAPLARLRRRIRRAASGDVVVVQRAVAPLLNRRFLSRLRERGATILYDFDDAVYLPQEGGRRLAEWIRRPAESTGAFCREAHRVFAGNRWLADFAAEARGTYDGVEILPSVVDTERFRPAESSRKGEPPTVGWIGSSSTLRYLEELAPHFRTLQEHNAFRLLVVAGDVPPELPGVDFEYRRWNPEAEVSVFQELDVGLYPLEDTEWGRGKCGFKAIQYLACGVPCVASPVGVLPDIVLPGETGFLARTGEEWVDAVQGLLRDPSLRRSMGARGRKHVEANYSVRSVLPMWEETLSALLSGGGDGPSACPWCGASSSRPGPRRGELSYRVCRNCGSAWIARGTVAFRDYYEAYDPLQVRHPSPVLRRRYEAILRKLEGMVSGRDLLEVGCGNGHFLAVARERGWHVRGTELSRAHVERARAQGLDVAYADLAEEDAWPDARVDAVVMIEIVEHVPQPRALLDAAARKLKGGGVVYLTTPNYASLTGRLAGPGWSVLDPEHVTLATPAGLRRALRASGFRVEEMRSKNLSLSEIRAALRRGFWPTPPGGSSPRLRPAAGREASRSTPVRSRAAEDAALRDAIEGSAPLRWMKGAANAVLAGTGLGDGLECYARRESG
ncbi:MAG: methyltransferase domain-containing protein [Gemmatimonadota bacterium]